MAFIEWNANFSVKVSEIDKQHQKLFVLINELHDAMKQGKGRDVIGKVVQSLTDYTVSHFKTEERYFDQFSYPKKDSHKLEHTQFIEKVSKFQKGFKDSNIGLSLEVMNFLKDWLSNHIKVIDQEYSQFFNEKGLR